jgi:hypothetical protein
VIICAAFSSTWLIGDAVLLVLMLPNMCTCTVGQRCLSAGLQRPQLAHAKDNSFRGNVHDGHSINAPPVFTINKHPPPLHAHPCAYVGLWQLHKLHHPGHWAAGAATCLFQPGRTHEGRAGNMGSQCISRGSLDRGLKLGNVGCASLKLAALLSAEGERNCRNGVSEGSALLCGTAGCSQFQNLPARRREPAMYQATKATSYRRTGATIKRLLRQHTRHRTNMLLTL